MFQKWYSDYTSDISRTINENLNFILNHFAASPFARTISTKTTQGQQITANNNEEALARFKQANYLDCRINAYSSGDLRDDPNFVFLDIDSTADPKVLDRILNFRLRKIGTVLFTGTGLDIYQPKESVCLNEIEDFSIYQNLEPSNQFLRFENLRKFVSVLDIHSDISFVSSPISFAICKRAPLASYNMLLKSTSLILNGYFSYIVFPS